MKDLAATTSNAAVCNVLLEIWIQLACLKIFDRLLLVNDHEKGDEDAVVGRDNDQAKE